ncbi:MAG: beta strand repeat-containing protein, partial [Terriglobia bacterium]
ALTQPAFSDLNGTLSLAQLPLTVPQYNGAITTGDCAKWLASGVLADAGAACGSGGSGSPGGAATQYQFNNTTFGGALSTYNSTTAESTFPNINNVYYVDGNKYATVEAVIADPNFKGGTIISAVSETFTSSPFQPTYPEQLILSGASNAFVWKTNVHINIPAQDKLIGTGWLSSEIEPGPSFPPAVDTIPTLGALSAATSGGSIPNSTKVNVVITAANANGETPASSVQSVTTSASGTNANAVTVTAPGAITNATGMNVYASTGSSTLYFLAASNQALTSNYTITSVPATGPIPPAENTSANLISLATGAAGSAPDTRVERLYVNCNSIDHGLGVLNTSAQENSGVFWARIENCYQGAIDIETSGAQNSNYQHLNLGGATASPSYMTGINVNQAQIRGIEDVTIVASGAQGVAAISLTNGANAGAEGCYRNIHIENFADGVYFHGSPGCLQHVTGLSNVGNLIHIDSASYDVTLQDIRPNGATNGLRDDTWTIPYQSGNTTAGFYSIGNGTGQARTYLATDAGITPNFQQGLTSGVPIPVASGGTGTSTPSLTAGSNISVSSSWPDQAVSFTGTLPGNQPGGSNQFLTAYNSSTGVLATAQPSFNNLSGTIAATQIAAAPITNDCPQWNGTTFQWAACAGGSGSPGGSPGQYQINNTTFAGSTTLTNTAATGAGSVIARPSTDEVPMESKCFASGASDCFEVFNAAGSKSVWVDASGNLNFLGNNTTYGAGNQPTQSFLRFYGSVSSGADLAPAYLQLFDGLGGVQTDLFASQTTAGLLCTGSAVPGGNCGPTVASTNYLPTVAGGIAPAAGDCVKFTSSMQIGDAGVPCGGGGGGSGTVNSGSANQIAYYAAAGTTVSGETVVPIANGGTGASTLSGANIPVQAGIITTGDCVKWASTTSITDAGAACGSGGGTAWSSLTAPAANSAFSMGGFTTTWNWTNSALGQFAFDGNGDATLGTSTTAAVADSPSLTLQDEYQSGTSAFSHGTFTCQMQPPAATNPIDLLNCTYTGSTGGLRLNFPNNTIVYDTGGSFNAGGVNANTFTSLSGNPVSWQTSMYVNVSAGAGQEYYAIELKVASGSTAVTAGQLVCVDTANANAVIVCPITTTDQFIGFAPSAISAGANGSVAQMGQVTNAISDGGAACALGNYVIVSAATAGDVACTGTKPTTIGAVIGRAMTTAPATAGSTFTVLMGRM